MTEPRTDPTAYRAAYTALTPFVKLAQVRGEVAERVARAAFEQRSLHGLDYMRDLAEQKSARDVLRTDILVGLPESFTSVSWKAVDAALAAAAQVLWDGTE